MQNVCFKILNRPVWNFYLTHKLLIDHLKVVAEFTTGDLDLDIQDQNCHESSTACVIPSESDN